MTTTTAPSTGAISSDRIASLRTGLDGDSAYRLARNGVTKVGADEVALNRDVVASTDWTFSTWLDDWPVTN
ncbi:MAG: aminopeptidase, partial [Phycisphaerae bacterium]|nr:aminopeptidase [Phycisphaerae bacterium]